LPFFKSSLKIYLFECKSIGTRFLLLQFRDHCSKFAA